MHFGSPSDPSQTAAAEAKPRCVYSILKPHGQSFRRQVRLLLTEAKPSYVWSILKLHGQSYRTKGQLLPPDGKRGYVYLILKPHDQSSKRPVRILPCQAKLSYIYTILKNITSQELVPSSCVRQHTQDVPAQRVLPSNYTNKPYPLYEVKWYFSRVVGDMCCQGLDFKHGLLTTKFAMVRQADIRGPR